MKTNEFIEIIFDRIVKVQNVENSDNLLKNITADSREVEKGTVFFCIKGEKFDGHEFARQAFEKGAFLVIGEKDLDIPGYVQVDSVKAVLKKVSSLFYGHPDRSMKMVAVTGTNGKTSTTFMIEKMLADKYRCGVIGTLGYRFNGKTVDALNTTPMNWKWYSLLNEMKKTGMEVVISEVSSHAIAEERIETTLFDIAVFTNLTRDHLDFHGDIENYYLAKKKLFTDHIKKDGIAVINFDDEYGSRLYNEIKDSVKCVRISEKCSDAELIIRVEKVDASGSKVKTFFMGQEQSITIPVIGKYNIYNTLSAFAVCSIIADLKYALEMTGLRVSVPGRLEQIGDESIFVDYAHTPDALENVLRTMTELNIFKRIITVIGAGGDRDRGKRPLMGGIASIYSDIVILTDDNPRTEDPEQIISDILTGCNLEKTAVEIINDRSLAIKRAVSIKKKDDVLIVAGKGAEDYQITSTGKRFFSDRLEIEKYLRELQNVHNDLS